MTNIWYIPPAKQMRSVYYFEGRKVTIVTERESSIARVYQENDASNMLPCASMGQAKEIAAAYLGILPEFLESFKV